MTANELLNKYLQALQMSDSNPIDLSQVILDILKYLAYKESGGDADPNATVRQYKNDKLWTEIMKSAESGEHGLIATINTIDLRRILEKYKILEQEKGM